MAAIDLSIILQNRKLILNLILAIFRKNAKALLGNNCGRNSVNRKEYSLAKHQVNGSLENAFLSLGYTNSNLVNQIAFLPLQQLDNKLEGVENENWNQLRQIVKKLGKKITVWTFLQENF